MWLIQSKEKFIIDNLKIIVLKLKKFKLKLKIMK